MNSTILKNGVTIFNIFMASTFIFWTIGCQSDDELESVNNSSVVACTSELEDFIIAATDLQQSLIVFEKELIKVNFADLETVINADGNKVTHLPAIIRSLNIEQKILLMNRKRMHYAINTHSLLPWISMRLLRILIIVLITQ